MKKYTILPAILLCIAILSGISVQIFRKQNQTKAMETVIRLHVRAADDTPEEQALKLRVRDAILHRTGEILKDCSDKSEAKELLSQHFSDLQAAGTEVISAAGKDHAVSVALQRERFEYREYGDFFLPEGEYDSLIVEIGEGKGQNWWCVVFPAACYVGAAEVETDGEVMPKCFRLATKRAEGVTVKWWFWEKIKAWFD